jgi:hypothetical protein
MNDDAPEDPVSPAASHAIAWHQIMLEYEAAGFTHDEAFKLTKAQVREYWGVVYDDMSRSRSDETG